MSAAVLVLDVQYRPLMIESWQRAITGVFTGKTEVVEYSKDRTIKGASQEYPMPLVVRVLRSFKRDKLRIKFSRLNIYARDNFTCQYCLSPDQKVLTDDLRWVPLGDIQVGDHLVGFNEEAVPVTGRRFTTSRVEEHMFDAAPLFDVILSDGTRFLATAEHQWLARKGRSESVEWCTTSNLAGKRLPRLFTPWSTENTREAGWLAGVFDGEGWLPDRSFDVAMGQNPGHVLDRAQHELRSRGFDFGLAPVTEGSPCLRLALRGAAREKARFLGQIRPDRLIEQFTADKLGRLRSTDSPTVICVSPAGIGEMVKMRTSTATFIADGFPQHNCGIQFMAEDLTFDHVLPQSKGGKTCWENIVTACGPTGNGCNPRKANRTPEQAGMPLLRKPKKPSYLPMITVKMDIKNVPKEWRPYWSADLTKG
jgi:5-methylcytosine-specific restriction endonuclease McrA